MDTDITPKGRLLIISNRLPVVINKDGEEVKVVMGSGGLVTALAPVLKNRGGVWIGWPGLIEENDIEIAKKTLEEEHRKIGYHLFPIFLDQEQVRLYYDGFANEIIWPLFHDLQMLCRFNPTYWTMAQEVNKKFAQGIFERYRKNDFIWVHDYHLMLVGQELRKLGITDQIGFFLHIPFPLLDIFVKLPWRFQVLKALLEYDLIGFQTRRDLRNFLQCIKRLMPNVRVVTKRNHYTCSISNREVTIGAFPISIDFQEFSKAAHDPEIKSLVSKHRNDFKGQKVVFSCDRLDMSKGIPDRLAAIRYFLEKNPEAHEKVTFLQLVIPSRVEIPKYQLLKDEIERLVSEINGKFTRPGWVPIHYIFHSVSRKELIVFYRVSDVALITPVKDGMNLVAKEYIASNIEKNGVLILSEFAGAVTQLQNEALLINPYDIEGVAEAIKKAIDITPQEAKMRIQKMRRNTQRYDVFWWVKNFLRAAFKKELQDFPILDEYNPSSHQDTVRQRDINPT